MMTTVPILFTFDENLLMPAGVCLTSLLESAGKETFYDIFILHPAGCDFTQSLLAQLPERYGNCRLTFRKVEGEFEGAFEIRGIPETAYFRLISPGLIPEYDHYLYSDVDVIFREDLAKYYALPLDGSYFAGVDSVPGINDNDFRYLTTVLKQDPADGYFYSGNLIINAEAIRADGKMDEFREHRLKQYTYQDMDIINLTCHGKIKRLPPAYCLTDYLYDAMMTRPEKTGYSEEEIREALLRGAVHFNGPKPWKEDCFNMDIWWAVYRRSIFFDESFAHEFWKSRRYALEGMSLWKRIKLVARYFRKGGKI